MSLTKSWMWPDGQGGVNGANIDDEDHRILWFDNAVACACGDSAAVQSFEQFRQDGPPFGDLPDVVLAEMHTTLSGLEAKLQNS